MCLRLAAFVALFTIAGAATPLTNYVLQAHGSRFRFATVAAATEWTGNTTSTWVPVKNSRCSPWSFPQLSGESFLVPLGCTSRSNSSNFWLYLLSLNASTGAFIASRNVSADYFPGRAFGINTLPDGHLVIAGPLSHTSSGLFTLDLKLKLTWSIPLCTHNSSCVFSNQLTAIQVVSATADVICQMPSFVYSDVSYTKSKVVSQLTAGDSTAGELDVFGKTLFVYNNGTLFSDGFWSVPLPLSNDPTGRVWFALPALGSARPYLFPLHRRVTDLTGNGYVLVNYRSASYPVVLVSYSATGATRWQVNISSVPASMQVVQPVLTDDETLLIVHFVKQRYPPNWWSTAYSTQTGKLVWSISSTPWYLGACTDPVPLANSTVLYTCNVLTSDATSALVAVDQRSGQFYPGLVHVSHLRGKAVIFDSGNSAFVCKALVHNNEDTVCSKYYLPPCIYYSASNCSL